MYSVKPGRGPSLAGVAGGLVAAVIGVLWTIAAMASFREAGLHGPPAAFQVLFVGFGVMFVLAGLGSAAYNLFNATSRERMSIVDVTRPGEEPDPISRALGHVEGAEATPSVSSTDDNLHDGGYCTACGAKLDRDFEYCPRCGHKV